MHVKTSLAAIAAGALLALPGAASAAVQVGSSGWSWGNPQPQGNTIRSMAFAGTTGYAAGDFGTLLKTVDAGQTWSGLPVGTFQGLSIVQAVSDKTVIAGGGCVARRSDDGGATFTRIAFTPRETKCPQPLAGLSFTDPKTGFLLLADGTVTETVDGGTEFTQRTAVPGTPAAGGQAKPTDISFITPVAGYVAASDGKIYATTDAGVSWKLVSDTQRLVSDISFVDPQHGFAVGDNGLFLRTTDGGATWMPKDVGAGGQSLTSVRCASAELCVMTTAKGDQLVRTADGGETATRLSPSTDPIFVAAFASPTQVVAAGANGSSVVSYDAGLNFAPVGGRLAGSYSGVRAGAQPGTAYAPGADGSLAVTKDSGKTWTRGNVATSEDVHDVSFPSAQIGYALDAAGDVFRTGSGGQAWQALDKGTTAAPNAILAPSPTTVLLVGGRGVRRSTDSGGTFSQVSGKAVARTPLDGVDRAGSGAIVAYGSQSIIRSLDAGKTWTTLRKPGVYKRGVNKLRIAQADFVTARTGFVRDGYGRIFRTVNGGRSWTNLLGIGTAGATGMAFSSATSGYLVVPSFSDTGAGSGLLLRTKDGGATWHPQVVIDQPIAPTGIAAPGGGTDYLLGGTSALLSTTSGGDAGASSTLSITTKRAKLTKTSQITVTGKLTPAQGNERVAVSYQAPGSTRWQTQTVNTAANGSFTTSWRVTRGQNVFVAQWAGDFKAVGDGSSALKVTVGGKR